MDLINLDMMELKLELVADDDKDVIISYLNIILINSNILLW